MKNIERRPTRTIQANICVWPNICYIRRPEYLLYIRLVEYGGCRWHNCSVMRSCPVACRTLTCKARGGLSRETFDSWWRWIGAGCRQPLGSRPDRLWQQHRRYGQRSSQPVHGPADRGIRCCRKDRARAWPPSSRRRMPASTSSCSSRKPTTIRRSPCARCLTRRWRRWPTAPSGSR